MVGYLIAQAGRLLSAPASGREAVPSDLRRLKVDLTRVATTIAPGSYELGQLDGVLAVVTAVSQATTGVGLAMQTALIEPGSLPERLLLQIDSGVQGANADLAERLGTDQWQVSRAGRRLRDLGLAERTRTGRLNSWTLTSAGQREVVRRRPSSVR